jgi:hypothetical protein
MTLYEETELRRSVMSHLDHALSQARQLPDQEFIVYLIEMAQIEVGPRHEDYRAPDRQMN